MFKSQIEIPKVGNNINKMLRELMPNVIDDDSEESSSEEDSDIESEPEIVIDENSLCIICQDVPQIPVTTEVFRCCCMNYYCRHCFKKSMGLYKSDKLDRNKAKLRQCPTCRSSLDTKQDTFFQIATDDFESAEKQTCRRCESSSEFTQEELLEHLDKECPAELNRVCLGCLDGKLYSLKTLIVHLEANSKCLKKMPWCKYCQTNFDGFVQLFEHFPKCQKTKKCWACKCYFTPSEFESHLKTATCRKAYSYCPTCDITFLEHGEFLSHLVTCSGSTVCPGCQVVFPKFYKERFTEHFVECASNTIADLRAQLDK